MTRLVPRPSRLSIMHRALARFPLGGPSGLAAASAGAACVVGLLMVGPRIGLPVPGFHDRDAGTPRVELVVDDGRVTKAKAHPAAPAARLRAPGPTKAPRHATGGVRKPAHAADPTPPAEPPAATPDPGAASPPPGGRSDDGGDADRPADDDRDGSSARDGDGWGEREDDDGEDGSDGDAHAGSGDDGGGDATREGRRGADG